MNEKALRVLEYNKIIDLLAGTAFSPMGSELIRELKPSSNIHEVRLMQQETGEAVSLLLRKGTPPMEGLNDIRGSLKKSEIGSILEPGDLLKIADHLRCARRAKTSMSDIKGSYPIIDDLLEGITPIKIIEDEIYNCIVNDDEISDSASTTLFNIRKQIREKNNSVREKLNSIIRSSASAKMLQEPIIAVRGDRFVVPVKSEWRGNFPGLVHDQSASGSTLFIEPMSVVEMNNDVKAMKAKEKAEIERILLELTSKVAVNIDSININNDILSQLDFIFVKARYAIDSNCMPPCISNDGYINIKNGRHPLINRDIVVPNSIRLGKDFNVLVITGPNTGGKTVTLKTTGLLTLMAMAGLQIPADDGSNISVFDQVFADIGDEQSIEQSLSTFSSHMNNIVTIMNESTGKSLCLFDELGAGTDPTEGAALAMSILEDLYFRGSKAIATTHYSELKVFAIQHEGVENASVEFDVETLRPTFRLSIGIPGKSNAFEISRRLGLNDHIIHKAHEFISSENLEFEDLIANLQHNKIAAEQERESAEKLKKEIQRLHDEYEQRKEKLERSKEIVISEAKQEARKLIKQAKEESEEIINEIKKAAQIQIESERNRELEEARKRLRVNLETIEGSIAEGLIPKSRLKPIKNVKLGDSVFITSLNQEGIVASIPDSKGELIIQVGIMKINVHISNLMRKNQSKDPVITAKSSVKISSSGNKSVTTSLDLRGQTLDEAMMNVDKYLDDVYLSYLNEVTIIHGKGTGVLRQGITDMLKHHSHVKAYRPGKYGEGGIGVTVVEIRR